jgi:hypothetical protein
MDPNDFVLRKAEEEAYRFPRRTLLAEIELRSRSPKRFRVQRVDPVTPQFAPVTKQCAARETRCRDLRDALSTVSVRHHDTTRHNCWGRHSVAGGFLVSQLCRCPAEAAGFRQDSFSEPQI